MLKENLSQLTDEHHQTLLSLKALIDEGVDSGNLEELVELACDQAEEITIKSFLTN